MTKLSSRLAVCTLFSAASLCVAHATTSGFVFCDANHNGQIDSGDVPMPGVLVVVTNTTGTFSNANWTATPNGGFAIALGSPTDTYVEYIHPLTLPPDATVVQPPGGVYTFQLTNNETFMANFLVSSTNCSSPPPPPPPPNTNQCCLHAHASIGGSHGRSLFDIEGAALPSCDGTNADHGEWDIVARALKLRFEGSTFDITNCGTDQDASSGAQFRFIEFQGLGTLKGFGGCHANFGVVAFSARAEDRSGCGADRLYFRVYTADGTTVLLISSDTSNALDVAPVAISRGNLQISNDCCNPCGHPGDHGNKGGNHGNGNGNGNGNGHGNGNGNGHGQGNHGH